MASNLRKPAKFSGFSLVEILVSVSIVATLAIVGIAYGNGYKASQNNAQRLSDVSTIATVADTYFRAKGDYPEPTGNRIHFDSNGSYFHSATGAYGVSSTVTSDLFWAEFLASVPTDPDTGNAYGYGKRKDGTAGYDIASVDRRGDSYYAYVRGTYDGSSLPSLVREYSGPGFVEDGKTDRLPYNPYEKKVTAKISSYAGTVTVLPAKALTGELVEGDAVKVSAGGYAILHVSDGSEVRVGSATSESELKLENLELKDTKGFLTKVRFALNGGEAWTKAPKLREDRGERSELEIVSGTAVASVRGTVFGMTKTAAGSEITLAVGELKLEDTAGADISGGGISNGTVKVLETNDPATPEDDTLPKKVVIVPVAGGDEDDLPTVTVNGDSAARDQLKSWGEGSEASTKPKVLKIQRVAGTFTVWFKNDASYNVLNVQSLNAEMGFSLFPTDTKKVLAGVSVSALPGYPAPTSTELKRLVLTFENASGSMAKGEWIVPGGTEDFEIDETVLPSGWMTDCPKDSAWFAKLGCQPKSLVAYAPYNRAKDLYAYDRYGRRAGIVASDLVTGTDQDGVAYKKGFERAAVSGSDGGAPLHEVGEIKGLHFDLVQGDDTLGYDVSWFGLDPKKTSIEVGVRGGALKREFAEIDQEMPPTTPLSATNPSYNANERRAYLWGMSDGTSLYYRVTSGGEKRLVLTRAWGSEAAKWTIQNPSFVNDSLPVSAKLSFGDPNAPLGAVEKNVRLDLSQNGVPVIVNRTPIPTPAGAAVPNINYFPESVRRVWIGSSQPVLEYGNVWRWHSQWGGKVSSTGEILDYVKFYSAR